MLEVGPFPLGQQVACLGAGVLCPAVMTGPGPGTACHFPEPVVLRVWGLRVITAKLYKLLTQGYA